MQNVVMRVQRIVSAVAQKFLKIGPSDEPVIWSAIAIEFLVAYQAAQNGGLDFDHALTAGIIAVIAGFVRKDVTPSKHLPESNAVPIEEVLPDPVWGPADELEFPADI